MGRPLLKFRLTKKQKVLITDNRGLAYWYVADLLRKGRIQARDMDELISLCFYRMCYAARKFDPSKGKFTTFAMFYLRTCLNRYDYNNSRIRYILQGQNHHFCP